MPEQKKRRIKTPTPGPDHNVWRGSKHDESLAPMRSILSGYLSAANQAGAVCSGNEQDHGLRFESKPIDPTVGSTLALLIFAAVGSGSTLYRLSEAFGLHTRDCYGIVRSVVEICVNGSYILAVGSSAAEKTERHAKQMAFRSSERESSIGDNVIRVTLRGRPEASELGLEGAIDEFTSGKGNPKNWSDLSVQQRIEVVGELDQKAMENLQWAHFAVYSDSSEILHGSLYGAMHFLGLSLRGRPDDRDALLDDVVGQHLMLLMMAGVAFGGLIRAFHAKYGFQWAIDLDEEMTKEFRAVPWLRRGDAVRDSPTNP